MTLYQLWDPTVQFQARSGSNLVNGQVKVTYIDRTTLAPVYDASGTVIQNPVTLDENGRAACYSDTAKLYMLHVYDSHQQLLYTQTVRPFPYDTTIIQQATQLSNEDGSIALTETAAGYDVAVSPDLQEAIAQNTSDISSLKTSVAAAKTEVAAGTNVTVTKTQGSSGQDIYTVSSSGGSGSSNILVVQYGDTVTLSHMQSYDTVLMQLNDKTFYLTELSSTVAHFMSSYPIAGETQIETCSYDGSTWSAIDIVKTGTEPVVLICGDTPTQTFEELTALAEDGLLYALRRNVIFPAVFWTAGKIVFYAAIGNSVDSWTYDSSSGWSSTTVSLQTKLTAGDGITLDADGVISATGNGKVASQEGQTPDYLGNVLKAGQNITVTKDGAHVRLDSIASGGIEVVEIPDAEVTAVDSTWHKLTNTGNVTIQLGTDITNYGFQYTASTLSKVTIATDLTHWHIVGCKDRGNGTIPVYVPAGKSIVCRIWQDFMFVALATGTDTDTNDSNSIYGTLTLFDSGISRLGSMEQDQASAVVNLMSSLIDTIGSMASDSSSASISLETSSITEVIE